jgi:hypothetical protein
MKKILYFTLLACLSTHTRTWSGTAELQDSCFTGALSSGYVFKHNDHAFREVYGYGVGNIITADGCYHPWRSWGIGAKISYWLATGRTTFFKKHTFLQEVPMTLYVRKTTDFSCGLQLYASLGGGAVWVKEKSYLGHATKTSGIGEVEAGFHYPICNRISITSAFRYLFPRQSHGETKVDIGGFDVRAGLGFSF